MQKIRQCYAYKLMELYGYSAVEKAIEQDEYTAIEWLDNKISELTREDFSHE